jgi:tRNA G10  N-methylase Trm11
LTDKFKFKKGWKWPPRAEKWVKDRIFGYSLHVCCGSSNLGDVRIDLYEERATIKADMYHLPFRNESFDTVICDPPWHIANNLFPKLSFALRDVLKVEGRLIFNSLWYPKAKHMRLVEAHIPLPKDVPMWSRFAVLSMWVKINQQLDSYLY